MGERMRERRRETKRRSIREWENEREGQEIFENSNLKTVIFTVRRRRNSFSNSPFLYLFSLKCSSQFLKNHALPLCDKGREQNIKKYYFVTYVIWFQYLPLLLLIPSFSSRCPSQTLHVCVFPTKMKNKHKHQNYKSVIMEDSENEQNIRKECSFESWIWRT